MTKDSQFLVNVRVTIKNGIILHMEADLVSNLNFSEEEAKEYVQNNYDSSTFEHETRIVTYILSNLNIAYQVTKASNSNE